MPHHKESNGKKGSAAKKITDLVLDDHLKVKTLYAELQKADDQHGEPLYEKMCWEIALHAVAEELILYPLQEAMDGEGKTIAAESREDHEKTKAALQELDGKPLKEKGVREKIDIMMKDLLEHMEKEESEDLVKLEELGDEKLLVAGHDFQQAKLLIPDVAPSNLAHSDQEADLAERDSHFKTPLALLSASIGKLKEILGTHGPSESVSVNKEHAGKEVGDDAGKDIPYNLRHRDEKGHVVPDDAAETAEKGDGEKKPANGGGAARDEKNGKHDDAHMASQGSENGSHHGHEDGGKSSHGKRSSSGLDGGSRKKMASDDSINHA
ncbi:hypothetical protein BV898_13994 [Hypsibius exemplaris]|uniref:Hemerythrin-like domain-containing protein n=1 Tax=Hypsibius exemplaris TaxID=2072580 RepID=A0A1W0W939_HYPEX|nr:hypothetical protein BV898_13994 [Hypsibius exemplaris]